MKLEPLTPKEVENSKMSRYYERLRKELEKEIFGEKLK